MAYRNAIIPLGFHRWLFEPLQNKTPALDERAFENDGMDGSTISE
jgi:hypothetical protein